jgi:UDP-glucose 4-epimerase
MRVLVTGGAGFIGSHLCEELCRKGHKVVVFIYGNVLDVDVLKWACDGAFVVFHLAALPSAMRSVEHPKETHEVNSTGTLNVLMVARESGVKKVVYASSSSVYGNDKVVAKGENDKPNPLTPYAISKLCGEHYCTTVSLLYGLNTVSLRYFNVYGKRQDCNSEYSAVIPRFIMKALSGCPPVIYGDGEQTRDFTFVEDVVNATILMAREDVKGVFNIGTGDSTTVNQLANLVVKILGKDISTIHLDERKGDARHSLADIIKARAIGYKPKYSLEEGLREMINGK